MNGIEYIERLMCDSIEMFFEEKYRIAILAIIGINSHAIAEYANRKGIKPKENNRFFREIAAEVALPQLEEKKALAEIKKFRNLFSHPESPMWDAGQEEESLDLASIIFVYCHDLVVLLEEIHRPIPAEVESFTAWFIATSTELFPKAGKQIRGIYPIFKDIDKLSKSKKLERGRRWLRWSVETYKTRQKELAECP